MRLHTGKKLKFWLMCSLLIFSIFLNIEPVHALNGFIDPNGDGSVGNWATTGTNRYTEIDEATRQPTVPNTADNVTASANNGGSLNLRMSSLSSVSVVTAVQVWVYHNDGSNGEIIVQLYDDNESTTRSGTANLTQSTSNAWHSVTFSSLALTQAQLDTLTVRLTASKNGSGPPATITVYAVYADTTYTPVAPTLDQSAYRLFNSINSTDVGSPLAALDTPAALNASGDAFRLRLLIRATSSILIQSGGTFKLQYVGRGSGSCASPSGGTPATYTDVSGSTLIAYNDLSGVTDGTVLTANANDPTHGGDTIKDQTVEESNNFTNSQSNIFTGENGKWDFALRDNGAPTATVYCLRAVHSTGTLLNTYTIYPQITTGNGVLSVDVVDSGGSPVASPAFSMNSTGYLFTCDPTSTTVGTSSQRVAVSNFTATPSWNVTIAATAGNTSSWSDGGASNYDFNDPGGSPAGCSDSGDTDSLAGQLSLDPSVGISSPRPGCNNTGISLGSSSAFNQGTIDNITLISASSSAAVGCSWELTGVNAVQRIPANQTSGNYSLNLTITATAV